MPRLQGSSPTLVPRPVELKNRKDTGGDSDRVASGRCREDSLPNFFTCSAFNAEDMGSLDVSNKELAPLQACADETKRDSARALECSAESHPDLFVCSPRNSKNMDTPDVSDEEFDPLQTSVDEIRRTSTNNVQSSSICSTNKFAPLQSRPQVAYNFPCCKPPQVAAACMRILPDLGACSPPCSGCALLGAEGIGIPDVGDEELREGALDWQQVRGKQK